MKHLTLDADTLQLHLFRVAIDYKRCRRVPFESTTVNVKQEGGFSSERSSQKAIKLPSFPKDYENPKYMETINTRHNEDSKWD